MMLEQSRPETASADFHFRVDTDEEMVIARAVQGETAAIDWIINRYRVRLVRLATVILGRSGEAEDAAQDAFINAFRSLHTYRRDGKFFTWLYRIVVRTCLDRKRQARWNSEVDIESLYATPASARDDFADVDLRILLQDLLNRLTPEMRAMLILRELEGLEYSDIALTLDLPVSTVKWRLHTARKQFQTLWNRTTRETENVR